MNKLKKIIMYMVTLLVVTGCVVFNGDTVKAASSTSITVRGKTLSLNWKVSTLEKKLGKHKAKYKEPTGLNAYVFNSKKNRFVIAYTKGGKVVGYFTLSKDFKASSVSSGYSVSKLKSKGFTEDKWCQVKGDDGYIDKYYCYVKSGSKASTQAFVDYWGNKKVYAAKVYLSSYANYFSDYGVAFYDTSAARTAAEKEIYYVTNAFRDYINTKKLKESSKLSKIARAHGKDMALNNYFSHYSLSGKSPFDRMDDAGIQYWSAGENIAAGQNSGANFVLAWVSSSGHRSNMTNTLFTKIGLGYWYSRDGYYGTYAVQEFIG